MRQTKDVWVSEMRAETFAHTRGGKYNQYVDSERSSYNNGGEEGGGGGWEIKKKILRENFFEPDLTSFYRYEDHQG